ncbi:S-formylglutathione hydrolase [Vibrio ruber]|uniref:S-formylglutathione hydrolase n=1 Tax=Vibrio ruber (strain DSM 16370 / JCM 11486 / BCRC 17186 / CECT 7878 / LMG 23124 / VR1) TaxID=1123498 RepID=A0A1R4LAJ7_VIBR1|nr:S-formylglutathione hydrolase [Vibrio ruber]WNJ95855.1 S-formylglutathione hydrolase [Vibrio ruber]SJN53449.1 S-formylglutathione hydrolase [Vibrio ruber DSM 16370]
MLEQISQSKVFGGWHKQYTHPSDVLDCTMRFAIYLPPDASDNHPVPVLYWLSGLTCTDENFMQKAGAFQKAAALGIAIVAPDTSPRGEGVPDDPQGAYDLGLGAGFYLNATQAPWNRHYQMYSYIVNELPSLIEKNFPVTSERSIAGHSMGGHGALTIGIKNPQRYRSISAFSPICHPVACPWGQKALKAYLGEDQALWQDYDATELLKQKGCALPILIDQGEMDPFLEEQLKPWDLLEVADHQHCELTYQSHPGYDHSYYFIQSFIESHLQFHALYLSGQPA